MIKLLFIVSFKLPLILQKPNCSPFAVRYTLEIL